VKIVTQIKTAAATINRRVLASMDATSWFHLVGLISAVALGIGFVAALVSVGLSWRINENQKGELVKLSHDKDVQIEKVRTDSETETKRIESESKERIDEARRESEEKIATLTAEAEQAKTERAEADKQIAIAKADAAKADERSAKSSVEVAKLQIVVAKAEQKRAEAEKALLELQQQVKPRHFTAEQRRLFISMLKNAPKVPVDIACSNDEACGYAKELDDVLRQAGYSDVGGGAGAVLSLLEPFIGIQLMQRHPGDFIPALQALFDAFSAIGVNTHPVWDRNGALPENQVRIVIGTKP
jgi:hypothetical protein